ncbi:hypothetical protein UFOVP384_30 [uncultured Caudovirales phage]|uniref:Uncharacterized protein n=1 Tax=uncultured Caudovirales phage TaxID=2100421 RepID=A0A6J7X7P9_9CAUD|nr:hypothetical protein UFOVP384_30 [uncultured Caudovirales phage]
MKDFNKDFKYDLSFGVLNGETWFHEIMTNKTIEVKSDRITAKTGNVYIEYESRGKASGIATSQADYWVYKFDDESAIIFKTDALKSKLKKLVALGIAKAEIKGGDDKTSLGILLSLKDLLYYEN